MLDATAPSAIAPSPPALTESPRRGRPRNLAPMKPISLRLPDDIYDVFCLASLEQRKDARVIMREVLSEYAIRTRLRPRTTRRRR